MLRDYDPTQFSFQYFIEVILANKYNLIDLDLAETLQDRLRNTHKLCTEGKPISECHTVVDVWLKELAQFKPNKKKKRKKKAKAKRAPSFLHESNASGGFHKPKVHRSPLRQVTSVTAPKNGPTSAQSAVNNAPTATDPAKAKLFNMTYIQVKNYAKNNGIERKYGTKAAFIKDILANPDALAALLKQ